MWVYQGLISALFLGFYDICKKHSVQKNATLPVLFLGTVFGALLVLPLLILSKFDAERIQSFGLYVSPLEFHDHFRIFLKSLIVSISWIFSYFAIKNLPISIVSPIHSSSPFFTLLGAIIIFKESPNPLQWAGLICILISFYIFSQIGKYEGIHFKYNKWIYFLIVGTLANACSGLYDKFLLQTKSYTAQTVQVWFSIYLVLILGLVVLFLWVPVRKKYTPFEWRFSIPLIGILLIFADFVYFQALTNQKSLIILLSGLRRGRTFIALIIGGIIFKELNKRKKLKALIGVMVGVALIVYASK